jgi:LCP family protein required for cell wall assembly
MTRYHDVDQVGGDLSWSAQDLPGLASPAREPATAGGQTAGTAWPQAHPSGPNYRPDYPAGYGASPESGQRLRPAPGRGSGGRRSGGGRSGAGGSGGRRPPGARGGWSLMHPGKGALAGMAAVLAMTLVVGVSLVAYAKYRGVIGSIHTEKVTAAMLGKRPPYTAGLNILVIGSDSRAGLRGFGTGIDGSRSDTTMLLHVAPGHARADIISFPRDSMVPILACSNDGQGHHGQQAQPGQLERLNSSFAYGGAPCLWKTLEQETGIRIQHFVEVNFSGFRSIVNDVHGVPVCLPFSINNAQSGLHLSAGKHVVNGQQALAFVRLRENIGEGSDTQRIQRQQYFLAAVMQKLKSTNLLADPGRIFSVVRDVAKSLTTDSGLDLTTMLRIATSMKSLNSSAVQFVTVPVVPYPPNPAAELSWEQPQAGQLFGAIEADRSLPAKMGRGKKAAKATPVATVSPSKISVQVLNGSGVNQIAGQTATALTAKGFVVAGTGPAANYGFTSSVIQYSTASELPAVNTLKAQIGGSVEVQQDAALGNGPITLTLGSSFTGLTTSGSTTQSPSASNLAKNYGGITASTNICSDSAAFAGPDTPLPGS